MALLPSSSYTPQATFTKSGKVKQTVYNVRDYGAKGDGISIADGAMSASGTTVTSASNLFVSGDVGKIINIEDAKQRVTGTLGNVASGTATLTTGYTNKGSWNASTNNTSSHTSLADGTGTVGDYYRVTTPGTINLGSGPITFGLDDYVIYSGSIWFKRDVNAGLTFVFQDEGSPIIVAGAGAAGSDLLTTILDYVDKNTVTLAVNASTTVTNAVLTFGVQPLSSTISMYNSAGAISIADAATWTVTGKQVTWGTDDSAAYTAAGVAATVDGGVIFFSGGIYFIDSGVIPYSKTIIQGAGRGATIITCSASNTTPIFEKVMTDVDFLYDWSICDLAIDGASGLATRGVQLDSSVDNTVPFYNIDIQNVEFRNCYVGFYHGANNAAAAFYVWNVRVSNVRFIDNYFGYAYSGVYSEWIEDVYFANNIYCGLMEVNAIFHPHINGPNPGDGPSTYVKLLNAEIQNTNPDYVDGTDNGILISSSALTVDHVLITQTSQIPFGVDVPEPSLDAVINDIYISDTGGGIYLDSVNILTGGVLTDIVLHACGQKTNFGTDALQMPIDILEGSWKVEGKIGHYADNHLAAPHAIAFGGVDDDNISLGDFTKLTFGSGAYSPVITNYMNRPNFGDNTDTGWSFSGTGTPTVVAGGAVSGNHLDLNGTASYIASYSISGIPPTRLINGASISTTATIIAVAFYYKNGTPSVELVQNAHSYGLITATTWTSGWQRYTQIITMQNSSNPLIINIHIPNGSDIQISNIQACDAGGIFGTGGNGTYDGGVIAFFDGANTSSDYIVYDWTGSANVSTSTKTFSPFIITSASQIYLKQIFNDNVGVNPDNPLSIGSVTTTQEISRVNGRFQYFTMTGNTTFTFDNSFITGDELVLEITQDSTGSRVATWPSNVKFAGGSLVLSTAANAVDMITLKWDGSFWREQARALANYVSSGGNIEHTISTNTTAASQGNTNFVYICTAALTLTLPTAVGNTDSYTIIYTGTSTVTIAVTGVQTINGASTYTLSQQYAAVRIVSNGSNWFAGSAFYPVGSGVAAFLASPTSANLATAVTNETGSGLLVFATTPTLTTPILGVATATTINKVTLTTPGSGSTLTVADGKVLTANSTITLAGTDGKTFTVNKSITIDGTDSTTMTFPATSATIARTDAAQTFTGIQTLSSSAVLSSGAVTVSGNTVTFPTTADTLVARATTDTLTNKRITVRITSTTSSSTPTPNGDTSDQYEVTALATNATFGAPSGSPTDGQKLIIRIKDDGTARTLAWNGIYVNSGVASLPATTVISKTHLIAFIYDGAATTWVCVAADPVGY